MYKVLGRLAISLVTCIFCFESSFIDAQPLDPTKQLTQYTLDKWGDEQGFPSGGAISIIQAQSGYLWIGTFNGIFRFDGITFTSFNKNNTPTISNNSITTIIEENVNGRIWAGSNGGGIYLVNKTEVKAINETHGLSSNVIKRLYKGRDGTIYIGTGNGLTIFKDSVFTQYTTFGTGSDSSNNVAVTAIYEDINNRILLGTNIGLYELTETGILPISLQAISIDNMEVLSITADANNTIYLATYGSGIIKMNGDSFERMPLPNNINKVSQLYFDSNKALWISHQNGVLRYYKDNFSALPTAPDSFEDAVEEVIEDREGSIWITRYNGGIERLRDGLFLNYTTYEGLSENITHCIYEDKDSSMWIATSKGVNHFKNGNFKYYGKDTGHLNGNLVRHIIRDRNGTLWLATYNGLTSIKNNKVRHYTSTDGLPSNLIRYLYEDSHGNLWIGTRNGLSVYKNGTFVNYNSSNGLSNNFIMSIIEPNPGEIWIATSGGGISIFKDDTFATLTTEQGLPSNVIFRMYKDADGVIWLATNNGLSRYDGSFFSDFRTDNGFLTSAIFQVVEDETNHLWITSDFGIIKIDKKELNQYVTNSDSIKIKEINYKQVDGLKRSECTAAASSIRASDGRLWFATLGGIAIVNIYDTLVNNVKPPVWVEHFNVDQTKYVSTLNAAIEIPAGSKSFEIKYTGLSLRVPQKVKFKYQLEGYDQEWVEAGSRRIAYYTNLSPGSYKFKVKATNNDGIWSDDTAEIQFYILPHFYQTSQFYIIASCIILFILWGIYHIRVRTIKKEQVRLKHIVEERTSEIQQQKEEIAAQRDKIEERSMKLEEAQKVIQQQNQKLTNTNLILEETVHERTEQLRISNQKLTEKNRELDLFIYRSAHDLQGPIARILGLCQLGINDNEPQSEKIYFQKLNDTALGMSKMLSRIIRIHHINIQKLEVDKVQPKAIVDTIFKEKFIDLDIADITLNNAISADTTLTTDGRLLKIALENLISNAYKFRAGTDVYTNFIKITALEKDSKLYIFIANNGLIIPDNLKGKIFDIFTVATDQTQSSGLGLYETKIIMEKLQGKIRLIDSNMEKTEFEITLPLVTKSK